MNFFTHVHTDTRLKYRVYREKNSITVNMVEINEEPFMVPTFLKPDVECSETELIQRAQALLHSMRRFDAHRAWPRSVNSTAMPYANLYFSDSNVWQREGWNWKDGQRKNQLVRTVILDPSIAEQAKALAELIEIRAAECDLSAEVVRDRVLPQRVFSRHAAQ